MIRRLWRKAYYLGAFAYWSAPLLVGFCANRLSSRGPGRAEPVTSEELDRIECRNGTDQQPAVVEGPVRVVTWNLCYGRKLDRIVDAMRDELKADIYLLQEVDLHCRRSGNLNVACTLADRLSFNYIFGVEFQELAQQQSLRAAFHGQAILSRFPLSRARMIRFRHQSGDWACDPLQPRAGGRMVLAAEVQLGRHRLALYNSHLESRGGEKIRQLQFSQLLDDACRNGAPSAIIAGDLNTVEASAGRASPLIVRAREAGFTESFCSCKGDRRTGDRVCLDWILARGLAAVEQVRCAPIRASDHEPVEVAASPRFAGRPESVPNPESAVTRKPVAVRDVAAWKTSK